MKTNNDYQMFFQGYLEALTDIDGDQREFGVCVKMFNSSNKDHLLDIQKEFGYKKPIEVIESKKFRNFYSVEYILRKLIFVKFFNGAKVPKKSVKTFRDYVVFHLMDYIDFAFDDATYKYGRRKNFEILIKRGETINTVFLVMSSKGKKLIIRFCRNKKYMNDKKFDGWTQSLLLKEEKRRKEAIKKIGIREYNIHSFLYKDYNKEDILDVAEQISVCEDKKSKYIEEICVKDEWKLKELIPLFTKGLDDVYGKELKSVEEIAKWRVISAIFKVGYKEEYKFKERLEDMLEAVKVYNKRFQSKKTRRKYKFNNKYGYSISPQINDFMIDFEKTIEIYKSDKEIAKFLKNKYNKETMDEVWKNIFSRLRES